MNKTRFADVKDTAADDKAKAESQRADIQATRVREMQKRIKDFFARVQYVTFASEESAPPWANNWRDYLLTGSVPTLPAPVILDAPKVELNLVEEPNLSGIEVQEISLPERDDPPVVDTIADADFRFVDEEDGIFPPPAA